MEQPRLEVVCAVPREEDLEGRGLGWRYIDVCLAITAGSAIRSVEWHRGVGFQLPSGSWSVYSVGS